jgi:hypothetical protein
MTGKISLYIGLVVLGLALTGCGLPAEVEPVQNDETEPLEDYTINFPGLGGTSGDVTFELATTIFPVENTLMVYQVKKQEITPDLVIEIGRRFGFQGDAGFIDRETKIAMLDEQEDEVRQLSVWVNSGAIEYAIVSPDKLFQPSPDLPSQEEAKLIALQFLTEADLLPDDVITESIEVVSGGSVSGVKKTEDGTVEVLEESPSHWLVRFPRQIDGLSVANSGGNTLAVRIGDQGEVINVFKLWREVDPYGEVELVSPQQAYQELISDAGKRYVPFDCDRVIIEQVNLTYWTEAIDQQQEYVVPVYEFKGKCLDKNGNVIDDYTGWNEAIK